MQVIFAGDLIHMSAKAVSEIYEPTVIRDKQGKSLVVMVPYAEWLKDHRWMPVVREAGVEDDGLGWIL